jgi:hypothetical protein
LLFIVHVACEQWRVFSTVYGWPESSQKKIYWADIGLTLFLADNILTPVLDQYGSNPYLGLTNVDLGDNNLTQSPVAKHCAKAYEYISGVWVHEGAWSKDDRMRVILCWAPCSVVAIERCVWACSYCAFKDWYISSRYVTSEP